MSLLYTKPLKMILALSLILTLARCSGGGSSDSSAALPQCTAALCLNGSFGLNAELLEQTACTIVQSSLQE